MLVGRLYLMSQPVLSMTADNVISSTGFLVVMMVVRRFETAWTSRHIFMINRHQVLMTRCCQ